MNRMPDSLADPFSVGPATGLIDQGKTGLELASSIRVKGDLFLYSHRLLQPMPCDRNSQSQLNTKVGMGGMPGRGLNKLKQNREKKKEERKEESITQQNKGYTCTLGHH